MAKDVVTNDIYLNPISFRAHYSDASYPREQSHDFPKVIFCVRFTIKVTPFNGAPISTLYKSFLLNDIWNNK
jgi:hypothetical protein